MPVVGQQLRALVRRPSAGESQRHQSAVDGQPGESVQCRPADEIGLAELDHRVESDLGRRRIEIGVLTDEDVALLQSEQFQCIEAVGHDMPRSLPRGEQRVPQLDAARPRVVQLEAQLADEPDAEGDARNAGDGDLRGYRRRAA